MSEERPTLKDIAERSGYALRTVKKVFSGTEPVGDKTRHVILETAAALKYSPNKFASALAKNRRIRVAIIYSPFTEAYFSDIGRGFEKCREDYKDYGLATEFFCAQESRLQHQSQSLDEIAARGDIDGVVIQPVSSTQLNDRLGALVSAGIPVVTFGSDAPESGRCCYVGPDAYRAGRVGAQLLSNYLGRTGRVCMIDRFGGHMQTELRMRGFRDYCAQHCPAISIRELNIPDDSLLYYEMTRSEVLREPVDGIFCTDAETFIAGKVLKDAGMRGTAVAGFDLGAETRALLAEDFIQIIIEQNPENIAYKALKIMFDRLFEGVVPPQICHTDLSVITSECIGD